MYATLSKLLLAAAALCLAACSSGKQELHLFTWGHYIKPELISRFETQYDCKVFVDLFDSNEAMYAKLKASGKGYDVVVVSNYFLEPMEQQGMLQAIDTSKVPNLRYLDTPMIQKLVGSQTSYAVPYMISYTGIGVRKDKLKEFDRSWTIFANTAYAQRMTMLNDIRDVFAAALKVLGYSINTIDLGELEEATELLIQWKRNLAKYESEQYMSGIASAEYLVVQGYSGQMLQVAAENSDVEFFLPTEGVPIACDYIAIPREAPNSQLALQFIDFLYDPEVAAENIAFTMYLAPNTAAYQLLPEALTANENIFPSQEMLLRSEVVKDVYPYTERYIKAWEVLRSAH